jgi:SAM-dependent methyltransferase
VNRIHRWLCRSTPWKAILESHILPWVMMLHHVPSAALQDRLLAEVARVLRPDGICAGAESIASPWLRLIHIGDVLLSIEPRAFATRLEAAGFTNVDVGQRAGAFRFRAQRSDCVRRTR